MKTKKNPMLVLECMFFLKPGIFESFRKNRNKISVFKKLYIHKSMNKYPVQYYS